MQSHTIKKKRQEKLHTNIFVKDKTQCKQNSKKRLMINIHTEFKKHIYKKQRFLNPSTLYLALFVPRMDARANAHDRAI